MSRGATRPLRPLTLPELQRFEAKVQRTPDGCWLWTAATFQNGYGRFSLGGQSMLAHRVSYTHFVGPTEFDLDHLCSTRACVNPEHLDPVTARTNLLRSKYTEAFRNSTKTHCANDHRFTLTNTYTRPDGWRGCRECRRAASSRWWLEHKM